MDRARARWVPNAPESAGLWPVVAGRVSAVCVVLLAVARSQARRLGSRGWDLRRRGSRPSWRAPDRVWRTALGGAGAGALAALPLIAYLLAIHREFVVVAVVLSSLYPLIPVLLGMTVLRERLSPSRAVGLAATLTATVLISVG